jgi:hypothetical protein
MVFVSQDQPVQDLDASGEASLFGICIDIPLLMPVECTAAVPPKQGRMIIRPYTGLLR